MAIQESTTSAGDVACMLHTRVEAAQNLVEDVYWNTEEVMQLPAQAVAKLFAACELLKQANEDASEVFGFIEGCR